MLITFHSDPGASIALEGSQKPILIGLMRTGLAKYLLSVLTMFMSQRQSENEEKGMANIVLKDRETKTPKACVVPTKGINDYAVRRLVKMIEELGHKRVILKSDGESSIVALKKRVKHILPLNIVLEESPVGDHGDIEMANQKVQG